jgi:hypothetical protein
MSIAHNITPSCEKILIFLRARCFSRGCGDASHPWRVRFGEIAVARSQHVVHYLANRPQRILRKNSSALLDSQFVSLMAGAARE